MEKEQTEGTAAKTFKEATGIPANEHAKKKAKEKSDLAKKDKLEEIFYTVKSGKILQIKVKPNGAHSNFVGNKKKLSKDEFEAAVKKWKAAGAWISEEDFDEKTSEVRIKLAEKALASKK